MTARTPLVATALLLLITRTMAAPPQVSRVTMPALQPGVATTLVIEGTDLIPTVDQQTRDNSTEYSACTSDEDLHFYSRTKCYSSRP